MSKLSLSLLFFFFFYERSSSARESHRCGDEFQHEFMIASLKEPLTMASRFYCVSLIHSPIIADILLSNLISFPLLESETQLYDLLHEKIGAMS